MASLFLPLPFRAASQPRLFASAIQGHSQIRRYNQGRVAALAGGD